ncbi:prepilin peptidase-dependent pilin [Providencia rettgeri]|uniref:prepilin peptidase-dependent pilin n=1 Tax=Providencia rettgeri TaxID=587 RepID=UPI0034E0C5FF
MRQQGFSLIEIMVVIAIISILGVIAIPSYQSYMQKAAMTEVLQTILPYKNSIEICHFNFGNLSQCSSGQDNIPNNVTSKHIKTINVKSGVVKFSGDKILSDLNVTLTPVSTTDNSAFKWSITCEIKNNASLKSLCEKTFSF